MSSGFFPLDDVKQGGGQTIKECIEKLEDLTSKYRQYVCEDLNAEDACSDGEYIGEIGVAILLLKRCIRETKGDGR